MNPLQFDYAQKEIMTILENSGGELTEVVEKQIEELAKQVIGSPDTFHSFLDKVTAIVEMCKAQKKRAAAYEKTNLRIIEYFKETAKSILELSGPIDGQLETLKLKKNPHKLVIEDDLETKSVMLRDCNTQIPVEYFKDVQILDKELLKRHLKNGKKIAGAHLEQGQSISFVMKGV